MASKFFSWSRFERRTGSFADLRKTGTTPPAPSSEFPELALDSDYHVPPLKKKISQPLRQKPNRLNLALIPPSNLSDDASSLDPAAVLHGAANSATNLLAAVNVMLRSPVLASFQREQHLLDKPLPYRPRSYTAPTTPIAELPGSLLSEDTALSGSHCFARFELEDTMRRAARPPFGGDMIPERPLTSPRELPVRGPSHKRSLTENVAKANRQPTVNMNPSAWSKESGLTTCSLISNPMSSSLDSVKARIDSDSGRSLQPSPMIKERAHDSESSQLTSSSITSDSENEKPLSLQLDDLKATITAQNHTISTLTAQFASLRTSHDAHIMSLADAHAKEVATLKTYTEGLEQREKSMKTLRHAPSSHLMLMLDTAPPATPDARGHLTMPSVTSIQSFETATENPNKSARLSSSTISTPKKASPRKDDDSRADMEKLRRKVETAGIQTGILLGQLNEGRDRERALINEVKALEARLDESNSEKVDALEAAQILEDKMKAMDRRLRRIAEDRSEPKQVEQAKQVDQAEMEALAAKLKEAEERVATFEKQVRTTKDQTETSVIAAFVRQIEDLQDKLKEKETYTRQLELQTEASRKQAADAETRLAELAKINDKLLKEAAEDKDRAKELREMYVELEASKAEQEKKLESIQKEGKDYYRILKSEIRKKACKRQECMEDGHLDSELYPRVSKTESPESVKRMIQERRSEVQSRMSSYENDAMIEAFSDPQRYIEKLEREIEYHVRDVIAFRLDIKGYSKDARRFERRLKKRDTLIQLLQDGMNSPNMQPNWRMSRDSNTSATTAFSSGLGISSASTSPRSLGTIATPPQSAMTANKPPTPDMERNLSSPGVTLAKRAGTAPTGLIMPATPPVSAHGIASDTLFSSPTQMTMLLPATPSSAAAFGSPSRAPASLAIAMTAESAEGTPASAPGAPRVRQERSFSDSVLSSCAIQSTPEGTPERMTVSRPGSRTGNTPDRPPRPSQGLFDSPASSPAFTIPRPGTRMGLRPRSNTDAKASVRANVMARVESHQRSMSEGQLPPSLPGKNISPHLTSPWARTTFGPFPPTTAPLPERRATAGARPVRRPRKLSVVGAPPVSNVRAIQAIREAQGKMVPYNPAVNRVSLEQVVVRTEDVGKSVI